MVMVMMANGTTGREDNRNKQGKVSALLYALLRYESSCVADTAHLDWRCLTGLLVGVGWAAWCTRWGHHHRVGYGVLHYNAKTPSECAMERIQRYVLCGLCW